MAENRNSIIDENSGFSFYLDQDEYGNDIAVIDSFTRLEDDLNIPETVSDGNGNEYNVKRLEIEAQYNSITIPDSVEINLLSQFNEVHLSERYKDFDAEELSDKLGILGNTMIYIGDTKIDYRTWSSYPNHFDIHSITDFGDRDSGFEGQLVIANNISQGDYLAITNCSHNGVVNSEEEKLSAYIPPADSGYVNSQTGKPFVNSDGELLHLDTVGTNAFYATPITDVVVPEGYKVVQYKAFEGCEYLTSASFPSTTEYYGQDLFEHCNNLEKITVNVSSKNKDNITPILPENIGYGPDDDMIIEYKDEYGRVLSSMTYGYLKAIYPSNDDDYDDDYDYNYDDDYDYDSNDYEEPAPDYVLDGISYTIDEETKHVTVCAIDDNLGKEISIPKEIEIEGEKYTVFSINQNAISSYSDVETLNLPYICYEDASWLLCNSNCQVNFYNESGQTVESATVQELYENRISWVKESEASGHYEGYDKAVIEEIEDKSIRSLVIPHKYDTCIANLDPELYSDDVVGIGKNILDGCNNVQRVCISRDVELPDGVFANCNATEYVLPTNERNNIERLGIRSDATITFANRYYENLNDPDTYTVLPVGLKYSEEHGQYKAVIEEIEDKSIRSLVIPHKYDTSITNLDPELYSDDVVEIGKNILDGCNNVEKVCISCGVDLPDGVFANCDATEYVLPTIYRDRCDRFNGEERPSDPLISLKERLGIRPDATITFANRYYENLNDPDTYTVLPVGLKYSEKHGQFADVNDQYSNPIKKVSIKAALDGSDFSAAVRNLGEIVPSSLKNAVAINPQSNNGKGLG